MLTEFYKSDVPHGAWVAKLHISTEGGLSPNLLEICTPTERL